MPVIFTFHPEIQNLLKKQYRETTDLIIPFKEWLVERLSLRHSGKPDKRLYLKNLQHVDLAVALFKALKDKEVSADRFLKGIEMSKLITPKKNFLKMMAHGYRAYRENDRFFLDDEDLYQLALERMSLSLFELDKAVVLALKLTSLELKLLNEIGKRGTQVEMIDAVSSVDPMASISVVEADSIYLEIESALKEIHDASVCHSEREALLGEARGISFIYCFQSWPFYSSVLQRLPLVHKSLAVLPWDENTMVLGKKNFIYVLGMSQEKKGGDDLSDFLLPEEIEHLNECLKADILETPDERRERTKQLLRYLSSCCERLRISYVGKKHPVLSEFLAENSQYAVERYGSCREEGTLPPLRGGQPPSSHHPYLSTADNDSRQLEQLPLPKSFSVSALRQYRACPYGFFLKECLGFYPKSLDLFDSLCLTAAEEGEIYHDILWRYFSCHPNGLEKASEESFEALSKKLGKEIPGPNRLRIKKGISYFLMKEKEWQKVSRFIPRYFEVPFEITLKNGEEAIQLRGKIDRLDVDEDRKEFKVIDYKTGGEIPSAKGVISGKDFQWVLYAIAAQESLLSGYLAAEGFCYHLKTASAKPLFEISSDNEWQELKQRTLDEVFSIASEIRKKRFHGTPENCYRNCELRAICNNIV